TCRAAGRLCGPRKTDQKTPDHEKNPARAEKMSDGPIADYEHSTPPVHTRQRRNEYYSRHMPWVIKEPPPADKPGWTGTFLTNHSLLYLPPIPAAESDVVAIGNVTDAHAYLTDDRSGIYSEFTTQISEVLKSNTAWIAPEKTVALEREGGVVKFASGRTYAYKLDHQNMPQTGRHYVFFLKYKPDIDAFEIITAYHVRKGRVVPLDDAENLNKYADTEVENFIARVRSAVLESAKGGQK